MDKSVSVAEYCRSFCERVVKGTYGESLEDNRHAAGEQFVSLVIKIQEAGSKDDIKVPLRVLRDEIGRAFFSGVGHKKAENIESLFQLYDALEASCQTTLKSGRTGDQKENATAAQLLEELRVRFVRLAIGETWDKFPELKFLALKRMYKYMVKEQEALRTKGKLALGGASSGSGRFNAKFMRTLSLQPSGSSGATWQAALEDLVKAPSNKLFPFVKLLLAENSLMKSSAEAAEPNGIQAAECGNPQSKDAGVARGISDFSLDDLLGLGPDPGPNEAPEAPTPSSDPFHPSHIKGDSKAPPPQHGQAPAFEAAFPDHNKDQQAPPLQQPQTQQQPPLQAQQRPGSNNPFGASSFGAPAFSSSTSGQPGQPGQAPAQTASSSTGQAPPATPAPSLATGAASDAALFPPNSLPTGGMTSRTSSGIPTSPVQRAPSVGRRTTSSEAEVLAPVPAPAVASSEGGSDDHAFETSFPPVPGNSQSFAGSGGAPTPSPFVKTPPAPARQVSGVPSMAGSMTGSGQLGRAGSSTFSPPQRTASSGTQPGTEGDRLASASSDTGSGAYLAPQAQTQPAAAATPARSSPAAAANGGFGAGQPGPQRAGPGSGSTNSGSHSFTPKVATGFEDSAFPGSPSTAAAQGNGAKGGSGSFNPFGLPSPTFASPVPVTADNRFADVSPMADAPPPSIPAPMRAPPAPPSGGSSGKTFSAW